MSNKITITTDNPALYDSLNDTLKNGAEIIFGRPTEMSHNGQIPLPLDTVIQIDVDLTIIHKAVLSTWLINTVRGLEGKHKIKIKDKQIPVDDPEAIDFVSGEIDYEE